MALKLGNCMLVGFFKKDNTSLGFHYFFIIIVRYNESISTFPCIFRIFHATQHWFGSLDYSGIIIRLEQCKPAMMANVNLVPSFQSRYITCRPFLYDYFLVSPILMLFRYLLRRHEHPINYHHSVKNMRQDCGYWTDYMSVGYCYELNKT